MRRRYALLALSALAAIVSVLLAIVVNVATGRPIGFLSDVPSYAIWGLVAGLALVAAGLAVGQTILPAAERRPDVALDRRVAELLHSLGEVSPPLAAAPVLEAPSRSFPPLLGRLIGRETEVAAIAHAAAEARTGGRLSVIALSGKPGVGKSVLALHAAHRLRDDFPDGNVYVEAGGLGPVPLGAAEILDRVLTQVAPDLGELPATADARVAHLRTRLADGRTLMLFDDVATESQIRPCLAGGAGTAVILTSRRPLDGLDLTLSLRVQTLPRTESIELIREVAGWNRRKRDQGFLDRLATLCGDLPLALRIAGALLRSPSWPLEFLCASLAEERHRLDLLKIGDIEVRASIALSYRQLTGSSQSMFRRLGMVQAAAISLKTAAALGDLDRSVALNVMNDLVNAQLVDPDGPERYGLHDLVRLYAAERADDEEPAQDRRSALARAIGAVAEQAWNAAVSLDPDVARFPALTEREPGASGVVPTVHGSPPHMPFVNERSSASTWLARDRESLVSLTRQGIDIGEFASAVSIALALHPYLDGTGRLNESLAIAGMAIEAAHAMNDQVALALAEAAEGTTLVRMGKSEEAMPVLERAAAGCRAARNLVGEGRALAFLGHAARDIHDFVRAEGSYRAALVALSEAGLSSDAAGILSDLGQILREIGRLDDASQMMERALQLVVRTQGESIRATTTRAWAYENLGSVRKRQGRFDEAVECHLAAAAEFGRLENPVGLAFSLRNLGDLAFVKNMRENARRAYEMSRDRFTESGNEIGESQAEASLALLHFRALRPVAAVRSFRAAARSRGMKYAALRMVMLAYLVIVVAPRLTRRRRPVKS